MAKETITKCDGCDTTAPVLVGIVVSVSQADESVQPTTYDMCPPCANRLADYANPTTWERRKRRTKAAKG